jgi:tRNA pseudouridine synthase 10
MEAEARNILERAAESSFPPLHAVHHLLSVGVRLLLLVHVLLEC